MSERNALAAPGSEVSLCRNKDSASKLRRHGILFTCWDFQIGGVCSFVLNQARAFRRRGHFVGAMVPEPFGQLYPDFLKNLDYVEIVRRKLESRRAYLRRLTDRIISHQPDVLINSAVPMVQGVFPYLPESLIKISMVHSIMDLETELAQANGQWVDWVVAVSDGARERFEKENCGRIQCVTIPVGLEMPRVRRMQEKAVVPLRLIYVGRISPEKNLPGLLRVLSALREAGIAYSMTVVGDGEDFKAVTMEARRMRFGPELRFLGMKAPAEVNHLLDEHDFLLMTSHFEGTPHTVLEAMAHGLVVVAPLLPGATDRIITHGVDGFLCASKSPKEYVKILELFDRDPSLFCGISQSAQNATGLRYTADALAARYESLFTINPVRSQRNARTWLRPDPIPRSLQANFPGAILQGKHLAADLWKYLVCKRSPVNN